MYRNLLVLLILMISLNLNAQGIKVIDESDKKENFKYENKLAFSPGFVYIYSKEGSYLAFFPGLSYSRSIYENIGALAGVSVIDVVKDDKGRDSYGTGTRFYSMFLSVSYYLSGFDRNSFFVTLGDKNYYEYDRINKIDLSLLFGYQHLILERYFAKISLGFSTGLYKNKKSGFDMQNNDANTDLGISIGYLF